MMPILPTGLQNVTNNSQSPQGISPLRLLTEGDRPALIEATVLPDKLPVLAVGEQITARIAEQLSNNQVAVLIKSVLFNLTLPPSVQLKGDSLNLRVASLKPGLTFTLEEDGQPGESKGSSVEVDLSPASRYLTRLLSAADDGRQQAAGGQEESDVNSGTGDMPADTLAASLARKAASLASDPEQVLSSRLPTTSPAVRAPLFQLSAAVTGKPLQLDVSQDAPAKAATQLRQGVENSGLFYESHLKSWDLGKLSLARVLEEPQAKAGQQLLQGGESAKSALPELGTMVQRQLNILETQQIPVQAFAWPGQPVQLRIEQDQAGERQAGGADEQQAWSTRIAIQLPVLGGLSALVRLQGAGVQLGFVTEDSKASVLIRNHQQRLETALEAAGLKLATLSVKNEENQG